MDIQFFQRHRILFCDTSWGGDSSGWSEVARGGGRSARGYCLLSAPRCVNDNQSFQICDVIKLLFAALRADDCRLRRNYFLHVCKFVGRRLFAGKMRKTMIYILKHGETLREYPSHRILWKYDFTRREIFLNCINVPLDDTGLKMQWSNHRVL